MKASESQIRTVSGYFMEAEESIVKELKAFKCCLETVSECRFRTNQEFQSPLAWLGTPLDCIWTRALSTVVDGRSHRCNRIDAGGRTLDVDLTGDQFGLDLIRVARAEDLFQTSRPRMVPAAVPPRWLRLDEALNAPASAVGLRCVVEVPTE